MPWKLQAMLSKLKKYTAENNSRNIDQRTATLHLERMLEKGEE
jgi:hypothetical protein